jgi:moderate conductance mechanosensitive channel
MEDSFLDVFFGHPADGTFMAWLVEGGLWAFLIALSAIVGWWLVRLILRRGLRQAVRGLDQHDATADVGMAVQAADSWISTYLMAAVFAVAAILGILHVLGNNVDPAIEYLKDAGSGVGTWIITHGLRIVLVLFLSWVVTRIARRVIPRVLSGVMLGQASTADHDEVLKRSETLSSVFVGAAVALIYVSALFMILTELTVPIGPVLGGFGIAGIAVGFGAQYLVRDLIAGIFILAENQYRTGDVVTLSGISGLVESINLRRTVLRDLDGQVHVIPNGEITVASNKTKYWSRVNLDVGVAYKEDVERVVEVLNDIGEEIAADPYFGLMLITPPQVLRLNSLDDSAVTFKMLGDCKPMKQWEIMGEMRKRIKIRLDAEGIEIPFPHQTVYWGEAQPSFRPETAVEMPVRPAPVQPVPPTVTRPARPEKPDGDLTALSPERREELLADIAIAAAARVGDADPDFKTRSLLIDTADNE